MYRPMLNTRDRGGALAAVIAIHAALLFAFLNLNGAIEIVDPQRVMRVFDVIETPPPPVEEPPPPPPPPQVKEQRAPEEAAPAAPQNVRSQATPIVAPKPPIVLPVPSPVNTTPTPAQGAAPTQGAGDMRGPGTGAGGTGTGTGSGGAGSGTGGGGGGEPATPVRLVRGITNRDYPLAIQRRWPRGGRIFLRLRVEADGRASQCDVMRSFGNPAADQWTCSLVLSRGVFRPATNGQGSPVAAWFGYIQSDTGRFER